MRERKGSCGSLIDQPSSLYMDKVSALRQETTLEQLIDQTLMLDEFDRTAPEATRAAVEREARR